MSHISPNWIKLDIVIALRLFNTSKLATFNHVSPVIFDDFLTAGTTKGTPSIADSVPSFLLIQIEYSFLCYPSHLDFSGINLRPLFFCAHLWIILYVTDFLIEV